MRCCLGLFDFEGVFLTLKVKMRLLIVIPLPSTSFIIIAATMNFWEFGVSCTGWICRANKNCRIIGWMGRQIVSVCLLPRIRRLSSRPAVLYLFSSSATRGLICMVSGMLQSLINREMWGSWVEEEDLLGIAFLGAITKCFQESLMMNRFVESRKEYHLSI